MQAVIYSYGIPSEVYWKDNLQDLLSMLSEEGFIAEDENGRYTVIGNDISYITIHSSTSTSPDLVIQKQNNFFERLCYELPC